MNKYGLATVLLGVLSIGGCSATKSISEMSYSELTELSSAIEARCISQGVVKGTPSYNLCIRQEAIREETSRTNARQRANGVAAGLSAGMQSMSDSYLRQANANRTVTCRTNRYSSWQSTTTCN